MSTIEDLCSKVILLESAPSILEGAFGYLLQQSSDISTLYQTAYRLGKEEPFLTFLVTQLLQKRSGMWPFHYAFLFRISGNQNGRQHGVLAQTFDGYFVHIVSSVVDIFHIMLTLSGETADRDTFEPGFLASISTSRNVRFRVTQSSFSSLLSFPLLPSLVR